MSHQNRGRPTAHVKKSQYSPDVLVKEAVIKGAEATCLEKFTVMKK